MSTNNLGIGGNIRDRVVKLSQSVDNVLMVFVVFKLMRMGLTYAALLIARNFTSQIYMDKVLVNDENPPHLHNFVYLYTIIDIATSFIAMLVIYTFNAVFGLNMVTSSMNIFSSYLLPDTLMSILLSYFIGMVVANKIYNKKYFLYKDDGLRGIRALTEIMMSVNAILGFIPFNFIFKGMYEFVKDI